MSERSPSVLVRWYHYIACFFAGAFLINAVPHALHGADGDAFPTPFANPPGTGLSSPVINVLWALGNILLGYLLLRAGQPSWQRKGTVEAVLAGFAVMLLMLAIAAPSVLQHYHQVIR